MIRVVLVVVVSLIVLGIVVGKAFAHGDTTPKRRRP